MKIITTVKEMQSIASRLHMRGQTIGFVPTMGALHAGHRALLHRARAENDTVVASIFVNPLQFGPKEDFKRYPRTLGSDKKILNTEDVDYLFLPSAADMYDKNFATIVDVPALTQTLCGPFRPGHFRGVATVVAKSFEVVQPTRAYFGEKDYQQLRVIARMAEDLGMPVRVVACPTVRERDGLAMSSRNRYLTARQREDAVKLYQALYLGRELVSQKIMTDSARLEQRLRQVLSTIKDGRVEYLSIVDPLTLEPMKKVTRPALLAGAVWIGKTRLIDNMIIA